MEKKQLNFCYECYLVNDAVSAVFGVFFISNFRSSGIHKFLGAPYKLKQEFNPYQSYEDSMKFPEGFTQTFKTFCILTFPISGIIRTLFLKRDYYILK